MKLRIKLPLVTSGILAVTVAAGLFGVFSLHGAMRDYARVIDVDLANERAVGAIALEFKIQVQEWKNTLLRGKDPAARASYWKAFLEHEAVVRKAVQKLQESLPNGKARSLIEQFDRAHAAMTTEYRKGFDIYNAAEFDSAAGDAAVKGVDREPSKLLNEAQAEIAASAATAVAQANEQGQRATLISLALMAATSIAGVVGSILFSRTVVRPIEEAARVAHAVASGDLTIRIEPSSDDEIGLLVLALKTMRESLHQLVNQIRLGVDSVGIASAQIAAGSMDLSARTEQQASSLEETAASMEQLTVNVQQGADNARQANEITNTASVAADKGGALMRQVVTRMEEISGASNRIAEIVGVIDGIAFQTNILALNAAVEAARAGEQGRGFAVVASEVRSLALKSAQAAREIRSVIVESVERVKTGSKLVDDAGWSVSEIVNQIERVAALMSQMTSAALEQSSGIGQINEAVNQMDQFTQQNAALVEQSAAAAGSLKEQAAKLSATVSVFQLGQLQLGSTH
jgi:methyl-accepting chemotaxis protein-1 (serine sensor receptor)